MVIPFRALCAALLLAQSAAGTPPLDSRLDALFAEWNKPDTPGVVAVAIRDGKTIYSRAFGIANLDDGTKLTPQSVFYMASLSKQVTAAAVARLSLEGRLSLDDDVRKFIPSLPAYSRPITVRNLLNHTSGLRDYFAVMDAAGMRDEDYFSNDDVVAMMSRQKSLTAPPGQEYLYSNSGYVLLAEIVKRASGQTLGQYAAEKFFKPLGLPTAHFNEDLHAIVPHRVVSYRPGADGRLRLYVKNFEASGDGNLLSSVEDLSKFSQALFDDALGVKGIRELIVTPGKLANGAATTYGAGMQIGTYRNTTMFNHAGSLLGFRGVMLHFPDQKFTVAIVANASTINPGVLTRQVADIVLFDSAPNPGIVMKPPVPIAESELDTLTGAYENVKTQGDFIWVGKDGGTLLGRRNGPVARLSHMGEGVFTSLVPSMRLRFASGANGPTVNIDARDQESVVFKRLPPVSLSAAQTAALVGSYWSDELATAFRIVDTENGRLALERARRTDPLIPLTDRAFVAANLTVKLSDDGLVVETGRLRDLKFVRVRQPGR